MSAWTPVSWMEPLTSDLTEIFVSSIATLGAEYEPNNSKLRERTHKRKIQEANFADEFTHIDISQGGKFQE